MTNSNHSTSKTLLIATFAMLFCLTGCIERRLTVNTNPQGALVTLNDEEIGTSPVTVEFNWYGDYNIRIAKEGYQTLNTHRLLEAPAHDKFPQDFFFGVLWPERIVDEYEWTFDLQTYTPPARAGLIEKANQMRSTATADLDQATEKAQEETELK